MSKENIRNTLHLSYEDVQESIKEEGKDTILIPMGSCEKHGAHIPLGTDSLTTISVTEQAAEKADVLHTPLVPFGYSPHHMGRPDEGVGTVTLRGDTYNKVLKDIAFSLIYHGYNKLIFVTHHGSNTKLIDSVLRQIRYEKGAFVAFYKTPTERECDVVKGILEGTPEQTPGWHSGEMETAQMLAYDENLVDMDKGDTDTAHAPEWMGDEFSKMDGTPTVEFRNSENIYVPMEHHEYCDTATIGVPSMGTKEKGEQLFDKESDHLAAFVKEVEQFDFEVDEDKRDYPERA